MDFKEEDFPVYQLLLKLNEPGVERAIADFEKARTGGDEERYNFALGIQTIAANCTGVDFPEMTEEMSKKTLQSCLAIFEDVASRGHANAAFMVEDFKRRGLGAPDEPQKIRLKEEDFPIYKFIKDHRLLTPQAIESIDRDLHMGGDENNLRFVRDIDQLMAHFLHGGDQIPGVPREDIIKTNQSCRAVFEDIASRGDAYAAYKVAEYDAYGIGLPDRPSKKPGPSKPKPGNFKFK